MFPLTLATGLLLGIRHALDPDHLVAVSTVAAEERRLWPAARLGLFWGAGHMLTLGLAGIPVLLLRLEIPVAMKTSADLIVGALLIILGLHLLLRLHRERIHAHSHLHGDRVHAHFHIHRHDVRHQHPHVRAGAHRASLTFGIGCVQGLAGSGAAALLALTASPSTAAGMLYLVAFGVGTALGMFGMTLLVVAPAVRVRRLVTVHSGLRALAGVASVLLGVWMCGEIFAGLWSTKG